MIRYERQHDKDPDYYIVGLNTDFEFPLHFHRCFELTPVPEGEMQVRREKENYTLRAGDMIFKETPFTLEEVSKELEYSSVYLSRFFHENTGMPYHEYARMVKMNHACYLLKNTSESILEVSLRCGYGSLSSFNRSFKQIVGMNPTEYRKKK